MQPNSPPPQQSQAHPQTPSFYKETRLDSGVLVLSHAMPESQSVALGIFVDVGSRDESADCAGITHALEHMIFKGTRHLDVHQLADKLDALGGNANAFTSRERTCFHLHVLREAWPEALSLLTEMICAPALPDQEWQREREVIYAEIAMVDDQPDEWIIDQHIASLFPDHPIGRPVLGSPDSLAALTREQLADYLHAHYCPPHLLITAAGAIEHDALVDTLNRISWPQPSTPSHPTRRQQPPVMHAGIQLLPRQIEQAQMILSYPGIHASDAARPIAWLANQMLGGGVSSLLFREVREKRGLAYHIGSYLNALRDTGLWSITCGAEPERMADCIALIHQLMGDYADQLNEATLQRAKQQLEVQLRMGIDAVEGQMLHLGGRLDESRLRSPFEWLEAIHAITLDQVQQWSRAQLAQTPAWSIAAPEQALEKISATLRP